MGLGRRTFAAGEVLTASNVMNYLMDQSVMNFAGTAARGSAIGTAVQQGMISYLNDINRLQFYNGTSWLPVGVVQIVSATTSTEVSNATTTLVDSGLTVTITPTNANNRIIVWGNQGFRKDGGGAATSLYDAYLLRNGASVAQLARFGLYADGSFGREINAFSHVETAGTTSALTFKTQFNRSSATGTVFANTDSLVEASIIAIEVSA